MDDSANSTPVSADDIGEAVVDEPTSTLDIVLLRMQANGDFPALSQAVTRIQRLATSETESVPGLAGEILKDVALTNKLLRLVNTVHYQPVGGGTVSTVSRAVALVGFAGIRNLALSLLLLERLGNAWQAVQLREEFVHALMAGQLASEMTPWQADVEEAYLAGMFQNMGRLLITFYLPEERQAIDALCRPPSHPDAPPALTQQAAAWRVLGVDYETLGAGVAQVWGLPDSLRRALHRPVGQVPGKAMARGTDRLRWLATLANDVASAMQHADLAQAQHLVRKHADQHARALGMTTGEICDAMERARLTLSQVLPAIGMAVSAGGATQRMLDFSIGTEKTQPEMTQELRPTTQPAAASSQMLAAGIQDVISSLAADDFQLNGVLRMVMETLLRGLDLRCIVFCLRDGRTHHLTGRFALGPDGDSLVRHFDIRPLAASKGGADLFSAVCAKGVDTVIDDATHASVSRGLPAWYRGVVAAPSFMLLPLVLKGATFGLLYADVARAGGLALADSDMALVRTLRNQAVLAFKQAS